MGYLKNFNQLFEAEAQLLSPSDVQGDIKYLTPCGWVRTFSKEEVENGSEDYVEWYNEMGFYNKDKNTWKAYIDTKTGMYVPRWSKYSIPGQYQMSDKPSDLSLIEFRRYKKCDGYRGSIFSHIKTPTAIKWMQDNLTPDVIANWTSVALEWINPLAAAAVDVAHGISYFFRASRANSQEESDKFSAAGLISFAFAAISGSMQAWAPSIKHFFTSGGSLPRGATGFANFLISNIVTIVRSVRQMLEQLFETSLGNKIASSIGCTRDYIVGLSKGLEEKALAVANTLKKEIEKS